jgi:protein TonB
VNGNPEIVISFVGYSTLKIKASEISKKPLLLKTKAYEIDLDDVPDEFTKEEDDFATLRISEESAESFVIVVDGKVVEKIDLTDPDDIERIEVIKDDDHELTRKYKAKSGVILITSKTVDRKSRDRDVLKVDDETFYVVEEMPSFPGGKAALKKYIYSKLDYPESAKKKGISGEVLVQFLVTVQGKLEDIQVIRSSYKGFDQPALDVFSNMPDWSPGVQRGKPVKVKVIVPVKFKATPE